MVFIFKVQVGSWFLDLNLVLDIFKITLAPFFRVNFFDYTKHSLDDWMDTYVQPFQYKHTQLISFEFHLIIQYIRTFLNVLQVIVYFSLVYVLLKKSPASMGAYKW